MRGQASVCKFTQQCLSCKGLEDSKIQMDLLGKRKDMILEQVLGFVEAKEAGKRLVSCLLLPQATDAVAGSSYRKQKAPQVPTNLHILWDYGARAKSPNKSQEEGMPSLWHQVKLL